MLKGLDADSLHIGDYSNRYLRHLLCHSLYYLDIYAMVLDEVKGHSKRSHTELSLVDYGAGNGLLGIFAKYCGFKKVILCDLDPEFIHAAHAVSTALKVEIDRFVEGDEQTLLSALKGETVHAITGTDVIEHVYNLDRFLSTILEMNPNMVSVFTTASNPDNYFKCRHLRKLQLKDELQGSDPGDFVLAGAESHEAFILIREKIIASAFPELPAKTLGQLKMATRGLNKQDIIESVQRFLATGVMPSADMHSSNTCNPNTGSWTERILTIEQYKTQYEKNGFSLTVKTGFYNDKTAGIKKYVNAGRNVITSFAGRKTAPFITLIGRALHNSPKRC